MSEGFMPREARAMESAAGRSAADMARAAGRMTRATERSPSALGHVADRSMNSALDTALSTSMAWWDLMMRMQRASLASLSVYSPGSDTRISASQPVQGGGAAVLPVGEERLNIGTETVLGETTRIRRRVVEKPVEQEVTLRDERVVVERRPASAAEAQRGAVLTETVVEMSESHQVPRVWKTVHVAEEVVLRREISQRTERVRDTLRRDVVEVEHGDADRATLARPQEEAIGRALATAQAEAEPVRREAEAAAEQAAEERRRREAKDAPQGAPGKKG